MQNSQFHCIYYWMHNLELWKINQWEFVGLSPPLILPIIDQNNCRTCKKTSVGILLSSWIGTVWNLSSAEELDSKNRYLKEQVHSDNLNCAGSGSCSIISPFLTAPAFASSCVWFASPRCAAGQRRRGKKPNSWLGLEIKTLLTVVSHVVCLSWLSVVYFLS